MTIGSTVSPLPVSVLFQFFDKVVQYQIFGFKKKVNQ